MLVAFDATAIGSGLGGDETLVTSLARGLARELLPGDRVELLAATGAALPTEVVDHPDIRVHRRVRRSGARHFTTVLPAWLAALPAKPHLVVTNTHAPIWSPAPVALMVPDLSFVHRPDAYPRSTRLRLQLLIARQARRAASVLTISGFSRDDLVATYGLRPDGVHVVPLTVDPPLRLDDVAAEACRARLTERGVPERYLLYLGNLHPRKNVARAVRCFTTARRRYPELADVGFVLAGATWWDGGDEEAAIAEAEPGSVVALGRVDDLTREVLLRHARALVYLSEFEGFGLPPLEAMARQTPVLAADATAIPEVCADAALLVPPRHDRVIEAALHRIVTDEDERARLVAAGNQRVAAYTIEGTGRSLRAALDATVGAITLDGPGDREPAPVPS